MNRDRDQQGSRRGRLHQAAAERARLAPSARPQMSKAQRAIRKLGIELVLERRRNAALKSELERLRKGEAGG